MTIFSMYRMSGRTREAQGILTAWLLRAAQLSFCWGPSVKNKTKMLITPTAWPIALGIEGKRQQDGTRVQC